MTIDNQSILETSPSSLNRLQSFLGAAALFHATFLGLLVFELTLIAFFFSFLIKSALVAIAVALFVLTVFCYAVLRLWFRTKRKEEFEQFVDEFQDSFRTSHLPSAYDRYARLTKGLHTLAETIKRTRDELLKGLPSFLLPIKPFVNQAYQRLVIEERLFMQELILERAISLWIDFIKQEPTHLEAHASLGATYITLSTLYNPETCPRPKKKAHEERFNYFVRKGAEEFKILKSYSPDDIWVHTQLAYSYHDLKMVEEEIKEWECIRNLMPHDAETLFKLGVLYFKQSETAKALSIYDELKPIAPQKAEQLIGFYA